jgi:hypothetical protein
VRRSYGLHCGWPWPRTLATIPAKVRGHRPSPRRADGFRERLQGLMLSPEFRSATIASQIARPSSTGQSSATAQPRWQQPSPTSFEPGCCDRRQSPRPQPLAPVHGPRATLYLFPAPETLYCAVSPEKRLLTVDLLLTINHRTVSVATGRGRDQAEHEHRQAPASARQALTRAICPSIFAPHFDLAATDGTQRGVRSGRQSRFAERPCSWLRIAIRRARRWWSWTWRPRWRARVRW